MLAGNQNGLVVGSHDNGVIWQDRNGRWTEWQQTGLPTGNPAEGLNDPTAKVQKVYFIALDSRRLGDYYAFLDGYGIFKYEANSREWYEVSQGLPRYSDACSESKPCQAVAVFDGRIYYVADKPGFFFSSDTGKTWREAQVGGGELPDSVHAITVDSDGSVLLGVNDGLLRGNAVPPFDWKVIFNGGSVTQITLDSADNAFLAVETDEDG